MRPLTEKEEGVMRKLWTQDEMTAKEIMNMYPEPRPHVATITTFLRVLEEKGWVKHRLIGGTNLYSAVLSEEETGRKSMKTIITKFFNGSFTNMVSTLIKKEKLSKEEIEELKRLVNDEDIIR